MPGAGRIPQLLAFGIGQHRGQRGEIPTLGRGQFLKRHHGPLERIAFFARQRRQRLAALGQQGAGGRAHEVIDFEFLEGGVKLLLLLPPRVGGQS